jgi:hypothetical protein
MNVGVVRYLPMLHIYLILKFEQHLYISYFLYEKPKYAILVLLRVGPFLEFDSKPIQIPNVSTHLENPALL